jgi:hypothetical protein
LRPAEIRVLRIEDFESTQLRIDEALKERQKSEERIGDPKTDESYNYVGRDGRLLPSHSKLKPPGDAA